MPSKIEFFDCSSEKDMIEAEHIIQNGKVERKEIVNFPYLMLVYEV